MEMFWGLLGPAVLSGERRTRTLGLGAVVRRFNDLAVPGIGGAWYGKQLLLAALGIQVAELARAGGARVSNVQCANAVEALACWLALERRGWESDERLRGSSKLPREHDLDFKSVARPGFYVTQPMRMATVQALPPLGLAEGGSTRFNSFDSTPEGRAFVEAACAEYHPFGRSVAGHLALWAMGKESRVTSGHLHEALSPCVPLSADARALLLDRLVRGSLREASGDKVRRRDALAWVDAVRLSPSAMDWALRPPQITDPQHWADMQAGAHLFAARDAAIAMLDELEQQVALAPSERWRLDSPLSPALAVALEELRRQAGAFLALGHRDEEASAFCRSCRQGSEAQIIARLVELDGRVLRRAGDEVRPGSAFRRTPLPAAGAPGAEAESEAAQDAGGALQDRVRWPEGISYRVHNLFLLNLDLHGGLGAWLGAVEQEGETT